MDRCSWPRRASRGQVTAIRPRIRASVEPCWGSSCSHENKPCVWYLKQSMLRAALHCTADAGRGPSMMAAAGAGQAIRH